jgi:hypothetical protein
MALSSGHRRLCDSVRRLLRSTQQWRRTLEELADELASVGPNPFAGEYGMAGRELPTPPAGDRIDDEVRQHPWIDWSNHRLSPRRVLARVLFPREFNRQLDQRPTKADVELELIDSLVESHGRALPSAISSLDITIDRLGGRRYYRGIVEKWAGGEFVATRKESAEISEYSYVADGREVTVRFRVKGDQHSLPVAASSLVAKFLREEAMQHFNDYWRSIVPDLRPTAGYPTDARRFYAAIEPHLPKLGLAQEDVWRRK